MNDDLIKAFETISSHCEKNTCTGCPLEHLCENYFERGTMRGLSSSAIRWLNR